VNNTGNKKGGIMK